eukprot:TRINITY_DN10580_c0_g1_i1.p1 TRINITY_DN10580_c0_g1~~TRINITY_DN10580_c0_g1_i1.p1  ORF type:complete len:457 (-),score=129.78 TRINITY_DN10580_c0_g1_i1:15-1385(-)
MLKSVLRVSSKKCSKPQIVRLFSGSSQSSKVFQGQSTSIKVPNLTFPDFLLDDALDRFKETALINASKNETLTYGKLKEKVNDLAIHFYIRGWVKGECVAVIMPNKTILPLTVLAATKIGLHVTMVNPKYKSREMVAQLKLCKALYIITTNELLPYVRDATASLRGIKEILVLDKEEDPNEKKELRWSVEMKYNLLFNKPPGWGALPDWEVPVESTCFIPFTNGGTKGAALTHVNMSAALLQLSNIHRDVTSSDVFLLSQQYYEISNMLLVGSLPFFKGAKTVMLEDFKADEFFKSIGDHKVTIAYISGETAKALIESGSSSNSSNLSSLRKLYVSGTLSDDDVSKLNNIFGQRKVNLVYSFNELTSLISSSSSTSSHGKLLPNTEAKILDDQNQELNEGQEGSLWVKGPQVMKEFYLNIEANKKQVRDGFVQTGDKAKFDNDGNLCVSPRVVSDE